MRRSNDWSWPSRCCASAPAARAGAPHRGAAAAPLQSLPDRRRNAAASGPLRHESLPAGLRVTVRGDAWRVEHDRVKDLVLMSGSACCGQNANDRTGVLAFMRPSAVSRPGGRLMGVPETWPAGCGATRT